ncbi:hypothetical protein V5799_033977 [Amblyomma americanum]|uniref:Uncharacterized protein n=1 Tax=Amblyomma americanum TaxID=6943 RepID=A0AAQ4DLS5_AMBAM
MTPCLKRIAKHLLHLFAKQDSGQQLSEHRKWSKTGWPSCASRWDCALLRRFSRCPSLPHGEAEMMT